MLTQGNKSVCSVSSLMLINKLFSFCSHGYLFKSGAVSEKLSNDKQGTKRKSKEDYTEDGFICSGPYDAQLPLCLINKAVLSNEAYQVNWKQKIQL